MRKRYIGNNPKFGVCACECADQRLSILSKLSTLFLETESLVEPCEMPANPQIHVPLPSAGWHRRHSLMCLVVCEGATLYWVYLQPQSYYSKKQNKTCLYSSLWNIQFFFFLPPQFPGSHLTHWSLVYPHQLGQENKTHEHPCESTVESLRTDGCEISGFLSLEFINLSLPLSD